MLNIFIQIRWAAEQHVSQIFIPQIRLLTCSHCVSECCNLHNALLHSLRLPWRFMTMSSYGCTRWGIFFYTSLWSPKRLESMGKWWKVMINLNRIWTYLECLGVQYWDKLVLSQALRMVFARPSNTEYVMFVAPSLGVFHKWAVSPNSWMVYLLENPI